MVVKSRLLLAVASALTLVMAASAPMLAASRQADPKPLRAQGLLRVRDIAANGTNKGPVVAVGFQEASGPGRLYLTFSTDGGKDYRRTSGKLRRFPVAGDPRRGLSLDVCSRRVWAASIVQDPNGGGSRVLMTSRTVGGGAAQQWISKLDGRKVRDVAIACAGNKLLAIGWLEKKGARTLARLVLRSMEPLGEKPAILRRYKLGRAELKSGFDVAATSSTVLATFVRNGDLRIKRFVLDAGDPSIVKQSQAGFVATGDITGPRMSARGEDLVVAYSDRGKAKARLSRDLGVSFSRAARLVPVGGPRNPSRIYSASVVGDRVVVEVGANRRGAVSPQRVESTDGGTTWNARAFGHRGARVGVLLKRKGEASLLMEAWHNNAPNGQADTLRARYEVR